jgi:hypothetical protein
MESFGSAYGKIKREITEDIQEVRDYFLRHFGLKVDEFAQLMSVAFLKWREIDAPGYEDERKAYVSALVHGAISLHILSMKLLVTGYLVAAGAIQRQVLETIALAALCSCKHLDILDRFINNKYSSQNSVRDAIRHAKTIRMNSDAFEVLWKSREFYHGYSHPTKFTIASQVSFSSQSLYVGTSFDEGKIEEYTKEMGDRVNLARVFANFVEGVKVNLFQW